MLADGCLVKDVECDHLLLKMLMVVWSYIYSSFYRGRPTVVKKARNRGIVGIYGFYESVFYKIETTYLSIE